MTATKLILSSPPRTVSTRRIRSILRHPSSQQLGAFLAIISLIAGTIFFALSFRISYLTFALSQQAQRISIWKDCRDRPDIKDILTCRRYLAADYESILAEEPRDPPPPGKTQYSTGIRRQSDGDIMYSGFRKVCEPEYVPCCVGCDLVKVNPIYWDTCMSPAWAIPQEWLSYHRRKKQMVLEHLEESDEQDDAKTRGGRDIHDEL